MLAQIERGLRVNEDKLSTILTGNQPINYLARQAIIILWGVPALNSPEG